MPAPHILSSFFSWLTFAFYLGWIEREGQTRYYTGMYLSFLLAALSGWVGYFVVPAILLHYVACEYKKTRNLRFVFSFALRQLNKVAILPDIYLLSTRINSPTSGDAWRRWRKTTPWTLSLKGIMARPIA
jgi:hypothetical protein